MPNRNSYLGVVLDSATMASLASTPFALQAAPGKLLRTADAVSFAPQEALHMTFIFFKEDLHSLPEAELRALHEAACQEAQAAAPAASAAPLEFLHFELFQVAARFRPSRELVQLREALLGHLRSSAPSLPARFWADIEEEDEWLPHVTLGKVGATAEQIGRISCTELSHMTPPKGRVRGLTLLGEHPKRAFLDWHEQLEFVKLTPVDELLELSLDHVLGTYPKFCQMFERGNEDQQKRWRNGWAAPDERMRNTLELAFERGVFLHSNNA